MKLAVLVIEIYSPVFFVFLCVLTFTSIECTKMTNKYQIILEPRAKVTVPSQYRKLELTRSI